MDLVGKRVRLKSWNSKFYLDVEWNKSNAFAGIDESGSPCAIMASKNKNDLEILDKPTPKKLPSSIIKERTNQRSQSSLDDIGNLKIAVDEIANFLDEDFKERNK